MKLGIIGTSLKKNEQRVPLHPEHLRLLDADVRQSLVFQSGYGERMGFSDADLEAMGVQIASRSQLLQEMDAILLLKPMPEDFQGLRQGGVLWGWPHCMQQIANTQTAIERRQTIVAMEQMFILDEQGKRCLHPFYKNNEMGGYCGVLHALSLKGWDGHYGKPRKVVILSFGAVGQGALRALQGRGFRDITVCTQQRASVDCPPELAGCNFRRIEMHHGERMTREPDGSLKPLHELISQADLLINAVLQDPNHPIMYLSPEQTELIKPGCYLLDISCDEGLGFPFSRPTSFDEPLISMGHFDYYSVDHTPNYLWEASSWEVSKALLPYVPEFLQGPDYWHQTRIFKDAIEIEEGVIQNPEILAFQRREAHYPHTILPTSSDTGMIARP